MPAAPAPAPSRGLREATVALRYRDFRRFWFAALASNTGSWMQSAAIPYVAFRLTGRDGGVGVTGFFQYVPLLLMSALGGALADRLDRRRVLVATQVVQAAFAVLLWLLVAADAVTPARLSALAFLSGLAGGLNVPVWQSFVSQLVPRDALGNAITLNSTQFNAARALGTFGAGIVIALWGVDMAFLLNAASFGAVLVVLPFIGSRGAPVREGPPTRVLADLRAGVRYVAATPGIVACCLAIVAIAGLCSPLFSFLTASYGQEIFRVEGWQLGLLWGAGGIGAVAAAPLLLTVGARAARHHLLVAAMSTYALATVGVGLAPSMWFAVPALVAYGGAYLAIASALNTTIQLLAREDMRGKSIAVYIMCLTGSLPLGLLVWGAAADRVGIRSVTVAAGVLLGVVTLVLARAGRVAAMAAADAVASPGAHHSGSSSSR